MATIAFDVYGTLIDTDGVVSQLREWIGSQADVFSKTWRSKQLEYSFRRGLMRRYETFAICTRHALDYCCVEYDVSFSAEQKDALPQSYRALPAFSDTDESLVALKAGGHRLFAFSNGAAEAVEEVLRASGLRERFEAVVSCDSLETFKPNPDVYRYFMKEAGCIRCHVVNGVGGPVGPALDTIASRKQEDYILQSLVDPGATIAEGYVGKVSPMPPMGVLLKPQELADIMAYLLTLK